MHALAYIWDLTPYPSLSVIHSPSRRTIYHYFFTLCCYIVEFLLLDNLVDLGNKVFPLSIHGEEERVQT